MSDWYSANGLSSYGSGNSYSSQVNKVNTSGLSGYAASYANALKSATNSGQSASQANTTAHQAATTSTGGSGISPSQLQQITYGGATVSPNTYVTPSGQVASQQQASWLGLTQDQLKPYIEQVIKEAVPERNIQQDLQSIMPQITSLMGQYSAPYEKLLKDMLATPSAFTMPSDSSIMSQATTKSQLQTDPLLQAIQSKLATEKAGYQNTQSDITSSFSKAISDLAAQKNLETANYKNTQSDINTAYGSAASNIAAQKAKEAALYANNLGEIDAAYAGVGSEAKALLEEVANNAIETAIAAGMGRSGKGEYLTAKGSAPIIRQVAQAEREQASKKSSASNLYNATLQDLGIKESSLSQEQAAKLASAANLYDATLKNYASKETGLTQEQAAKLSNAANLYNATVSDLTTQTQNISGQQGKLTSSIYDDLLRYYTGLGVQQESAKWGQGMDLANLANTSNMGQQNMALTIAAMLLGS